MWTSEIIDMIVTGIGQTLYMTLVSTALGYLFGLPMGVLLAVTDKDGLTPHPVLYKVLDAIANQPTYGPETWNKPTQMPVITKITIED